MAEKDLTVEAVYVGQDAKHARHTESYLLSLSDTEWTELRKRATASNRAAAPFLRCGWCKSAVYVKESKDSRRHCSHFGDETSDCPWSDARGKNLKAIDAAKFQGRQEGPRHKELKAILCETLALNAEAASTGIHCERFTRGFGGEYAFPDVFTECWHDGATAFEIQLANTQLPHILRRETFYETNSIRLCWIVDSSNVQLKRRAFKDIYLTNDGQIFGVDEDTLEASLSAQIAMFRLHRLLPVLTRNGLKTQWRTKLVTHEEIDWGNAGSRPASNGPCYDDYLRRLVSQQRQLRETQQLFYDSLAVGDEETAERHWNEVAEVVGGQLWKTLGSGYDNVRALGVLATIRLQCKSVPTAIDPSNKVHLINSMLLEPRSRRSWTHALELLLETVEPELLEVHSVADKCERNKAELGDAQPPDLAAGAVFNVFFPEGAFGRLQLS